MNTLLFRYGTVLRVDYINSKHSNHGRTLVFIWHNSKTVLRVYEIYIRIKTVLRIGNISCSNHGRTLYLIRYETVLRIGNISYSNHGRTLYFIRYETVPRIGNISCSNHGRTLYFIRYETALRMGIGARPNHVRTLYSTRYRKHFVWKIIDTQIMEGQYFFSDIELYSVCSINKHLSSGKNTLFYPI